MKKITASLVLAAIVSVNGPVMAGAAEQSRSTSTTVTLTNTVQNQKNGQNKIIKREYAQQPAYIKCF